MDNEKCPESFRALVFLIDICYNILDNWLHGQAVKTLASHAGIRGSIPLGVILKPSNYKVGRIFSKSAL